MFAAPAIARPDEFLLVRRNAPVQAVRITEINDQYVEHLPVDGDWQRIRLDDCIAVLNPRVSPQPRGKGMLALADGQRLPGEAVASAKDHGDSLAWSHPWLGRVDVPLRLIRSVRLAEHIEAPAPGQEDVVLLVNGDRQEGLVLSLGDPIELEIARDGRRQTIHIPLNVVAAATLIAPPLAPSGRRIWFDEGTVMDVQSLAVGPDKYVRLMGPSLTSGTQPTQVVLNQVAAILFNPGAMVSLASLAPTRVEAPATRYVVPRPLALEPGAPLALSPLEFRGPITVRYSLPAEAQRFSAEAELPRESREWGDFELVVRTNDDELFRTRLNREHPAASINVHITGRELTIELTSGAYGPIQDHLVLHRAMLLMRR